MTGMPRRACPRDDPAMRRSPWWSTMPPAGRQRARHTDATNRRRSQGCDGPRAQISRQPGDRVIASPQEGDPRLLRNRGRCEPFARRSWRADSDMRNTMGTERRGPRRSADRGVAARVIFGVKSNPLHPDAEEVPIPFSSIPDHGPWARNRGAWEGLSVGAGMRGVVPRYAAGCATGG